MGVCNKHEVQDGGLVLITTEACQKKHCTDGLVDPQDCSGELFLSFANVVLLYSGQPLQYINTVVLLFLRQCNLGCNLSCYQ